MSGERSQRPPPGYGGGRGPSFFDGFFGGDPFAHMDSMFRSMGMGADLLGGLGSSGGGRTFQARQASSTAREIPIEGPDDEGPPSAQHRLTGPLIDELPDHEQAGHEHLFFSSPDHVEEPEEEELLNDPKFEPPSIFQEPEQQQQDQQQQAQQQPPAARAAEPSQPQAAPVPPPPWQSQQRYNSSSSSGGGQPSAEELLAAMGSLPLGSPQVHPPGRPAGGPGGWAAGGGDSEGPGSPLLVHTTNTTSPFSPQRGGHLLDADRLPPHLPAFGSLGGRSGSGIGGGTAGGGMAGGAGAGMPPSVQVTQAPPPAAAAPLADWLTGAFGAGAGGQPPQGQQAAGGRPVSWDEHAGMFVATPVSSAQPPTAVQLPSGSPGEVAGAGLRGSQPDSQGGGSRSIPPPSLFRSAGADAEAGVEATGAAQPLAQQMADGASKPAPPPQQRRQRRLPTKLREAVEAQLHYGAQQQGATAGRLRRAAAGRKRPRGSSEEEEAEEAGQPAAAEEEDPDWAVPRRPRAASASGGRPPKRGRRGGGSSGSRTSRGGRR